MDSSSDHPVRSDVGMAFRDLALEMLEYHQSGTAAAPETIRRWRQSLHLAHRAHSALPWCLRGPDRAGHYPRALGSRETCFDARVGQSEYCERRDRW
jgi:hypothetical protein